jgi:GAF domain-containing protein
MDTIIKKLVLDLGASSGAIMVVNEDAKVLSCGASYNMPDVWVKLINPLENIPARNTNGRVACTGVAEISNNDNVMFHGYPIESIIVVPIKNNDIVVGNIEIISDNDKVFDTNDQKHLESYTEELAKLILQRLPPR